MQAPAQRSLSYIIVSFLFDKDKIAEVSEIFLKAFQKIDTIFRSFNAVASDTGIGRKQVFKDTQRELYANQQRESLTDSVKKCMIALS